MANLSIDIIGSILSYLETKDLILASRINKKWNKSFKNNLWKYKIDLSKYYKKITDHKLIHLKGIHTINLYNCNKITNLGLIHLKDVHTIDLRNCHQITDVGLSHLKGVHNINLNSCYGITDAGLIH